MPARPELIRPADAAIAAAMSRALTALALVILALGDGKHTLNLVAERTDDTFVRGQADLSTGTDPVRLTVLNEDDYAALRTLLVFALEGSTVRGASWLPPRPPRRAAGPCQRVAAPRTPPSSSRPSSHAAPSWLPAVRPPRPHPRACGWTRCAAGGCTPWHQHHRSPHQHRQRQEHRTEVLPPARPPLRRMPVRHGSVPHRAGQPAPPQAAAGVTHRRRPPPVPPGRRLLHQHRPRTPLADHPAPSTPRRTGPPSPSASAGRHGRRSPNRTAEVRHAQ
ncbi:hypothetical protein SUDANB21_06791 (plasmid) [Streptomyces sp. enrichment culture]